MNTSAATAITEHPRSETVTKQNGGHMVSRYAETYAAWQRDPLNFWAEAAKEIDWIRAPQNIFDAEAGVYGRWFPDATCNTCWNALDRHVVAGQGARIAFVYDSPLSGQSLSRKPHCCCSAPMRRPCCMSGIMIGRSWWRLPKRADSRHPVSNLPRPIRFISSIRPGRQVSRRA